MEPSITDTPAEHMTLVMPADLTVIVIVMFIVPPKTVGAGGSTAASSTGGAMGRNAPVCGSRYPKMPGFAWLFAD